MLSKQEQLREKILYKFVENNSISKRKIATELNNTIRTVQRVIKRYVYTGTVRRKSGSGRKRKFVDRNLELKVLKSLQKNLNLSIRDLARKHRTTKSTVQRIKQRHSIKLYKKVKVPKRDLRQHTTAKSRARKLYKRITSKNFCIMMDDKTYYNIAHQYLAIHPNLIESKVPYYKYSPEILLKNSSTKLYWYQSVIADGTINCNKPDIIQGVSKESSHLKNRFKKKGAALNLCVKCGIMMIYARSKQQHAYESKGLGRHKQTE
ncbi:hypothetical protein ILUMI_02473 [Ignelater luminosus]|uniref:Uncharacterized protein n=1 Tax=Ignelater luminosus TaxID=2038154 RepID=A0A8K0DGD7_IGNLU|nr:hypothetical protein ILUMI_02473 [Ignelater luminosus]